MKIGIDARELLGKPTGVGRYLCELLRCWAVTAAGRHRFILYSPLRLDTLGNCAAEGAFDLRHVPGHSGAWWEQIRLPPAIGRDNPDVFFAPAYTGPIRSTVPIVLTVHDVSFVAHPEWFSLKEGFRRRALTTWSAQRAAIVLTVSQFSKQEIIDRLSVPAERIRVIRQGIDARFQTARGAPRDPLVLFVGSIFNRRQVPELIRAFSIVAKRHATASLTIVGENRTHPHQDLGWLRDAAGLRDRVRIEEYVSDDRLSDLYSRASVFVFLSEYEGFGLTPLEALSAGVPLVLLDTPVAREVYRDTALFVAPGDLDATAAAIQSLLSDPDARASLLARAPALLEAHSWQRVADETLDALVAAAGMRRS